MLTNRYRSSSKPETHRASEQLREMISGDVYPLHCRLPAERKLCELLRVSRSSLRICLQTMEEEGRIWRHVGKGTFVGGRPQSVHSRAESLAARTTLTELLESRMHIEPQVARLAALRAEPSDLALLERYDDRAAKAKDWASWERWDELFHRAVAEASGNGLLMNMVDQILRINKDSRFTITQAQKFDPHLRARYSSEHLAIVSCIIARDPLGAESAMARHMRGVSSTIGPVLSRAKRRADDHPGRCFGSNVYPAGLSSVP